MKPIITFLIVLFYQLALGQNTSIVFNDTYFESYCVSNFDINQNGTVESNEVMNVTMLSIPHLQISDLNGISYFTSLERLFVSHNNLSSIDLSNNVNLKYLYAGNNNLQTIDINGCVNHIKNLVNSVYLFIDVL